MSASQTPSSTLCISGLRAAVAGTEILRGIDLEVRSGEVHAIMGPNGAGKSTLGRVLMGHPDYEVLSGSIMLDGVELTELATWQRAQAGLFFSLQDPTEVPGVAVHTVIEESLAASGMAREQLQQLVAERLEAGASELELDPELLERGVNVDCSGGEKKRIETLQLVSLRPKIAVLDEIDSGLDIDALRLVSRRVERATVEREGLAPLGVLAITHYRRLLNELHPDVVHVLVDGRIVERGGFELINAIEASGYEHYEARSASTDRAS